MPSASPVLETVFRFYIICLFKITGFGTGWSGLGRKLFRALPGEVWGEPPMHAPGPRCLWTWSFLSPLQLGVGPADSPCVLVAQLSTLHVCLLIHTIPWTIILPTSQMQTCSFKGARVAESAGLKLRG